MVNLAYNWVELVWLSFESIYGAWVNSRPGLIGTRFGHMRYICLPSYHKERVSIEPIYQAMRGPQMLGYVGIAPPSHTMWA